ncbi:glycosyltransferase [Methylobacterium sp. J-070]|nr:glycosyltransferase [Methylobacterium sp. J-070]
MNHSGQTICLSMIVKNEAHVIRRCLESVRPIIDHWVIVDTGSTDGTGEVIRAALADVPGTLVNRPWVDFAANRGEALELARPHGDYALIIDADDELIIPAGFVMPHLDAPGYAITILDKSIQYWRTQMVSREHNWYYRGVLHEFLTCDDVSWVDMLPLSMRRGLDGARHRDPGTFRRDLETLERALATEQDPLLCARYTFYLAQCYRDCGADREALHHYLRRAELGFWNQEIYVSLLNAAGLMERLNEPGDAILALYDRAIAVCPERAEARYGASRICSAAGDYARALQYARDGLPTDMPTDALFVSTWIYTYGLKHEYALNAFQLNQSRVCLHAWLDVLQQPDIEAERRAQISSLARVALRNMVDPIWGIGASGYRSEYVPAWQT